MPFFRTLLGLVLSTSACAAVPAPLVSAHDQANLQISPVILISIDGFRADYLARGLSPHLAALAENGVRARSMRPAFPSITFPNHFTLVTGLYPDHHGVSTTVLKMPNSPACFE